VEQIDRLIVLNKKVLKLKQHFTVPFSPWRVLEKELIFAKYGRNDIKRNISCLQLLYVMEPEFIFNKENNRGIDQINQLPCIVCCIGWQVENRIGQFIVFPDFIS